MTKCIMHVHTGAPQEYETGGQRRRLKLACHLQLRRTRDVVVGTSWGRKVIHMENKANVW